MITSEKFVLLFCYIFSYNFICHTPVLLPNKCGDIQEKSECMNILLLSILMLILCLDQVGEGVTPRGIPPLLPAPPSVASTFKIFVPRTKDMNKGFLTFSDNDQHSTGNTEIVLLLILTYHHLFFDTHTST